VVGYLYHHGGRGSGSDPEPLLPEFVAHFKLHDDPMANFRGMSWLTPIIGEILGDSAATSHKTNFFGNGANLGYVVTLDPEGTMNPEQFKRWVETFKIGHEGAANAYKTLFLSRGADVKIVGTDLKQLDFKAIQGAGETRIARRLVSRRSSRGSRRAWSRRRTRTMGRRAGRSLMGRSGRCGVISRGDGEHHRGPVGFAALVRRP
jgi:hypothetical protein